MKNIFRLSAFCLLLVALSSCGTTQQAIAHDDGSALELQQNNGQDLVYYIKQLAGVQVRGSGSDASITVRGIGSVNLDPSPLFVVNGNPMGSDFSQIYNAINPDQIKRVEVLKDAIDTSMYGMRGAMGVIEITLK